MAVFLRMFGMTWVYPTVAKKNLLRFGPPCQHREGRARHCITSVGRLRLHVTNRCAARIQGMAFICVCVCVPRLSRLWLSFSQPTNPRATMYLLLAAQLTSEGTVSQSDRSELCGKQLANHCILCMLTVCLSKSQKPGQSSLHSASEVWSAHACNRHMSLQTWFENPRPIQSCFPKR